MATSSTVAHINEKLGLFNISKEVTAGTPNWSFTAASGATTSMIVTNTDGATHNNALAASVADFFIGAQLYVVASVLATNGSVVAITDYATAGASSTFTFDTLDGALAIGDTVYVFWPLPASNITVNVGTENIERDFVRQTLDKPSSLKGLKTADGSFDVEIPGCETASGDASAAGIDRHSAILSVLGTRTATVGTKAVTGTLGTSLFDVDDAAFFTVGQYVLVNNEVRRITVITNGPPDQLTVVPALTAAPVNLDVVYAGEQWIPDDSGHQTLTILHLKDDRLTELRGAVCNVKLSAEFGQPLTCNVEFNAAYIDSSGVEQGWDLQDAFTAMDGSQIANYPPVYKSCPVSHFVTTQLSVASWEFDTGHERTEHRYCNSNHFTIQTRNSTMAVNFKDTTAVPKETWETAGTQGELIMAAGNSAGDCVAIGGNAQIQDPISSANNNEFQDWNANYAFVDDQTSASTPLKPRIVRF